MKLTSLSGVKDSSPPVNGRAVYGRAFVLCLLAVFIRGWSRLLYPHFWAEDGAVFFADVFTQGLGSLTIPFAGSYHTIQRLIAWGVINFLPVAWWPGAVCFVCYVLSAAIAATLVRPGFAWLIPSLGARYAGAIMLCFAPGLGEMLGNLANLNWQFFIWLALLGLRDPREKITLSEWIIAALVILSVGTSILLLPLFAWRWSQTFLGDVELKANRGREFGMVALIGISTAWLMLMNRHGFGPASAPTRLWDPRIFSEGPTVLWAYVYRFLIFGPWLSSAFGEVLVTEPDLALLHTLFQYSFLFFVGWLIMVRRYAGLAHVLIFVVSLSAWPVLCWIARPGTLDVFVSLGGWTNFRYSYPVGAAAVIFWLSLIHPETLTQRGFSRLALVFIIVGLGIKTNKSWVRSYYDPKQDFPYAANPPKARKAWSTVVPELEKAVKTGCPSFLSIPVYPEGWGNMPYYAPPPWRGCQEGS